MAFASASAAAAAVAAQWMRLGREGGDSHSASNSVVASPSMPSRVNPDEDVTIDAARRAARTAAREASGIFGKAASRS